MTETSTRRTSRAPMWVLIIGVAMTLGLAWLVQSVSQNGAFALVTLLGVAGSFGAAFAVKHLRKR